MGEMCKKSRAKVLTKQTSQPRELWCRSSGPSQFRHGRWDSLKLSLSALPVTGEPPLQSTKAMKSNDNRPTLTPAGTRVGLGEIWASPQTRGQATVQET